MRSRTALGELVSFAARTRAFSSLVGLLERVDRCRPDLLSVLTYHRVDDPEGAPELYPGLVSATPDEFEEQMRFLASSYRVVSMTELLDVYHGRSRLRPRSVMVTFDDGYGDFARHAWPIMRRLGLPVTVFVPTAYPDNPNGIFWWDRLYYALSSTSCAGLLETPVGPLPLESAESRAHAFRLVRGHLKSLPHETAMARLTELVDRLGAPAPVAAVLGWQELRRLAGEGVTIAPHSRTHAMLDRVSPDELRAEIRGSADDLEREIGSVPAAFAYPSGGYSDAVVAAVEEAGLALAFTTRRGGNDLRKAEWLRLRRINVGRRSTLALIRAQLLSSSVRLNHARHTFGSGATHSSVASRPPGMVSAPHPGRSRLPGRGIRMAGLVRQSASAAQASDEGSRTCN